MGYSVFKQWMSREEFGFSTEPALRNKEGRSFQQLKRHRPCIYMRLKIVLDVSSRLRCGLQDYCKLEKRRAPRYSSLRFPRNSSNSSIPPDVTTFSLSKWVRLSSSFDSIKVIWALYLFFQCLLRLKKGFSIVWSLPAPTYVDAAYEYLKIINLRDSAMKWKRRLQYGKSPDLVPHFPHSTSPALAHSEDLCCEEYLLLCATWIFSADFIRIVL